MTHIVHAGETVGSIAARYGVSVAALMRANRLRDAHHLYVGQSLRIPLPYGAQYEPNAAQPTYSWQEVPVGPPAMAGTDVPAATTATMGPHEHYPHEQRLLQHQQRIEELEARISNLEARMRQLGR